ncbi:MAG: AIR synthase-related protein [Magnetococcus sp. DMHC-1]
MACYKITIHRREQGRAESVQSGPAAFTIPCDETTTDYYLEFARDLAIEERDFLVNLLSQPLTETGTHDQPLHKGEGFLILYKRGIVDNQNDSLVQLCQSHGLPAVAGKVGRTYHGRDPQLEKRLRQTVFNAQIQEIFEAEPYFAHLSPQGNREPARTWDLRGMTDTELATVGVADGRNLSLPQMQKIQAMQGRLGLACLTDCVLEALDARWSDHCFHTTWKSLGNLLGRLSQTTREMHHPNVVSAFVDNAGVWDFYAGHCLVIKAETHNGPTALAPYFGQLTKLGGVLRDILGTGQGADPIGSFEYTATGLLATPPVIPGRPTTRQIALETIEAIKEYGNTFGVPMMLPRMDFHPDYRGKPFALGGSLGIMPRSRALKGQPQADDLLLLIGGLTGNDGIHGASASSAGASMDNSAVQIGSPLEQIKFRYAILELRDADCIRAITDVGGAGLNSAVGEMGEPVGVWVNTALVPLKIAGLATWRILLSESQERMVLAIPPEKLPQSQAILERHLVRHTVIGRFTGTGRFTVIHDPELDVARVVATPGRALPLSGEVGMDLPYSEIADSPLPTLTIQPPPDPDPSTDLWPPCPGDRLAGHLERMLADLRLADQSFATSQYDSTVQGWTWQGPTCGTRFQVPATCWAGVPLPEQPCAAVFGFWFEPWLFAAHPQRAARQGFLALVQKMVLAGCRMEDVGLCDNFYTPDRHPHGHYWLVAMVEELERLSRRFRMPFISGKDSSAGSARLPDGSQIHVPPAVFLSAVGKVPDVGRLRPNCWTTPGNLLVQIGLSTPAPAGTLFARLAGLESRGVDLLDIEAALHYLTTLEAVPDGVLRSAVPIEAGGILARVALSALASDLGADLDLAPDQDGGHLLQEHRCGALVEVAPGDLQRLDPHLHPVVLGRITDQIYRVRVGGQIVLTSAAINFWQRSFQEGLAS